MNKTTINGVDCYGTPAPGQNYQCTYNDEDLDFIAVTIEARSWQGVLNQLNTADLVEVVAV